MFIHAGLLEVLPDFLFGSWDAMLPGFKILQEKKTVSAATFSARATEGREGSQALEDKQTSSL